MIWLYLITLFLFYLSVDGALIEKPSNLLACKLDDDKCNTALWQWIYTTSVSGVPGTNIQSQDPIYHERIDGNLGYVKYSVKKSNVEGFKSCKIKRASYNSDATTLYLDILCQRFHMDGDYVIDGKVLTYPIKGKGTYYADTTNYHIAFESGVQYREIDGKTYASVENTKFKFEAQLLGDLDIELRNLFNGNKQLSDPVHNFARQNGKVFIGLLHNPVIEANVRKLIIGFNKVVNAIPVDQLIQK